MLSNLLHPSRPYKKAQKTLDQYYQQGQQALAPYMQQGQSAYEPMFGAMQNLLDPAQLQGNWINSYQMSPYAQDLMGMAQNQGLDAASSMGLMGSSPALKAIQAGTTNIYNADRQNYLNDLMQKYLSGAEMAQGLYGSGQNAANQFGQNAMNMGQASADLTYNANQAGPNMLAKLLGGALGGFAGGFGGLGGLGGLTSGLGGQGGGLGGLNFGGGNMNNNQPWKIGG